MSSVPIINQLSLTNFSIYVQAGGTAKGVEAGKWAVGPLPFFWPAAYLLARPTGAAVLSDWSVRV